MRGYRKITVDGQVYEYRIGRGSAKVRGFPSVNFSELTGRSWETLERGQWKRTSDGMVGPRHIRKFILSQSART